MKIEKLLLIETFATEATGPLSWTITFFGIVSWRKQVPQWMQWTFQWQFNLVDFFNSQNTNTNKITLYNLTSIMFLSKLGYAVRDLPDICPKSVLIWSARSFAPDDYYLLNKVI